MSHVIDMLSNVRVSKTSKFLFEEGNTEFPVNPVKGEFAFVSGVLYMYTSIRNIETWYPLTNPKKSYIHVQAVASISWTVNHNLSSTSFVFMVYDSEGNLVLANPSNISENSFVLNFTSAITGKVIVFVDVDSSGIPTGGGSGTSGIGAATHSASIGNGVLTSFTINHNLDKSYVVITIKDNSTNYIVYPDIKITSTNQIIVEFAAPPTANQYSVSIVGF